MKIAFLWDIRFYRFLVNRFCEHARTVYRDYQFALAREKALHSCEDWKIREAKAHLLKRKDISLSGLKHLQVGKGVGVGAGAGIIIPEDIDGDDGKTNIILGENCYLGDRVELQVSAGNTIRIGDYATVNANCVILGDVSIGRYCLLSYNVYMSSGDHYATLFPAWVIRDQDAWIYGNEERCSETDDPVRIEEDCLIGYGVFIKRGIYVGRGSVIGANSVVTKDIPPYSIQAGVPNRELSRRLDFQPPSEICAGNADHRPYFYAGFLVRQADLEISLRYGVVLAGSVCRMMLRGSDFETLRVQGRLLAPRKAMVLNVRCNAVHLGQLTIDSETFDLVLTVDLALRAKIAAGQVSAVLKNYNEVELELVRDATDTASVDGTGKALYGISRAAVYSADSP